MTVSKLPNWPTTIAKQLHHHKSTEFVWGESDCCLVVADIVKEFTGTDFAEKFRGKYTTELGATRAIKKYATGGSLACELDDLFTRTDTPKRGDLALVKTEAGESMAIIFSQRAWAMGLQGLTDLPLSSVVSAWEVK